jgi:hypothetical protein
MERSKKSGKEEGKTQKSGEESSSHSPEYVAWISYGSGGPVKFVNDVDVKIVQQLCEILFKEGIYQESVNYN